MAGLGLGSAALAGIVALSAVATALGASMGIAAVVIAAVAGSVILLVAELLALFVILEDIYNFVSGSGGSLIGDFVKEFENGQGVLASFARYLLAVKEEINALVAVAQMVGLVIHDVFVLGFQLAGMAIDELMASSFGRFIEYAVSAAEKLNPLRWVLEGITEAMRAITSLAGPVTGFLQSVDSGLKGASLSLAGGQMGSMAAMSGAAAPVMAGGSSSVSSSNTVNSGGNNISINVQSTDPRVAATEVARVLAQQGRADIKRTAGGNR